MNRHYILLALFTAALAIQPVFAALAGAKLYVEQEGSESSNSEGGGYTLYNSQPDTGDSYTVPLRYNMKTTSNTKKVKAKIPSSWQVLGDDVVKNRISDTKRALANAAKLRAKLSSPAMLPTASKPNAMDTPAGTGGIINKRTADKNKKIVEKEMKKQKKKADKERKKNQEDEDRRKAEEEEMKKASMEPEDASDDKKKGLKLKKKSSSGSPGKRVFNLPE